MTGTETLTLTQADGIATVTLTRPSINVRQLKELTAVCDELEDNSDARVVVFRGAKGVFSDGIDFGEFHPDQALDIHGFNKWEKLCTRLERLPKATIALVDGPAVGGGLQIALVCDLRLATPASTFQAPEAHLGFLPGMATFRLAKYIGLGHAKRFLLTCEVLGAARAAELGMIDRVVDDLDAGLAQAVASLGPNHSVAVTLTRRLLNESYGNSWENAIGHFLAAQHRAISQDTFLQTLRQHRDDADS